MQYTSQYKSPLGNILLAADEIGLTGLWFEGQKYFALYLDKEHKEKICPFFKRPKGGWTYICRQRTEFKLPLHFIGTPFQNEVWEILYAIPYGQTKTYGEIAQILAGKRDWPKCPHRPSAVLSDIMKFRLSCPATVLSGPPEA